MNTLNVREWIDNEVRSTGRTTFDFFSECWNKINSKPCGSNRVVLDSENYRTARVVPNYVWSVYDKLVADARRLPPNVVKLSRFMDGWNHQHYRLVDDSPPLRAFKMSDGVWRTL